MEPLTRDYLIASAKHSEAYKHFLSSVPGELAGYTVGICFGIGLLLLAALCILRFFKSKRSYDDDGWMFGGVVLTILAVIVVSIAVSAYTSIKAAPEAWATDQAIKFLYKGEK